MGEIARRSGSFYQEISKLLKDSVARHLQELVGLFKQGL